MSFRGDQEHENLDPAWSPHGKELAFTTAGYSEIAAIDVRTCAVRRVTHGVGPTWSPDGKQIAFEREDVASGESALFVADSDGDDEQELREVGDALGPDWSPSGDRLVFFRYGARDLFVARPDGSEVHRLTHVGAVGNPAWSPDGKRIAVECGGDASLFCIVDGASGRELRRIDVKTDIPDVSWSPDGETIAFAGNTGQGLGPRLLPLKTGRPSHPFRSPTTPSTSIGAPTAGGSPWRSTRATTRPTCTSFGPTARVSAASRSLHPAKRLQHDETRAAGPRCSP
jgi:Tol biopolymer transport system component